MLLQGPEVDKEAHEAAKQTPHDNQKEEMSIYPSKLLQPTGEKADNEKDG
jgi:hypothetical protein